MSSEPNLIYHGEDYPHGSLCMDCGRPFEDGDPYSKRLTGFIGRIPVWEKVCVACGLGLKDAS